MVTIAAKHHVTYFLQAVALLWSLTKGLVISVRHQMGINGLRVAYEMLGPKQDPNAPHNRPKFSDPPAVDYNKLPVESNVAGVKELQAAAGTDRPSGVLTRLRRSPRSRREPEEVWDGEHRVESGNPESIVVGASSKAMGSAAVKGKVLLVFLGCEAHCIHSGIPRGLSSSKCAMIIIGYIKEGE